MSIDIYWIPVAFALGGWFAIWILWCALRFKIKRADLCDSDKRMIRDALGIHRP